MTIAFARHIVAPGEAEAVREVLESGRTEGDGPATGRATARLESLHPGSRVLLTTSCTHALELAALVLGVGPGDEVVMPSFTFVSTANAFALRGARIRFADIDPETFTMEAAQVEAALTPSTKFVCTMPYGGITRDPVAIDTLCASRGIRVVVDAAHSIYATHGGRALATWGTFGALSFHKTKNISCGEGGAIVVNDASLFPQLEIAREKGTDRSRFIRGEVDRYTWRALGSSYLPSDILAAVLDRQLAHAEVSQARRHAVWNRYAAAFGPLREELGIGLQSVPPGVAHPAHVFAVTLPEGVERAPILRAMVDRGIYAVSHYEPLHLAPAHPSHESLPQTESIARRLVRLPLHAALRDDEVDEVIETFVGSVRKARG